MHHSTPLCRSSSPSNSILPHTRSNQHSTRNLPRKRNNSKVSPNKPPNNPYPSSALVEDPVDTVLEEDRSTFVVVAVVRRIVVGHSLGHLGDRSFAVGTEDRLGSNLGSTYCLGFCGDICAG
jgi:hypothetical protein